MGADALRRSLHRFLRRQGISNHDIDLIKPR